MTPNDVDFSFLFSVCTCDIQEMHAMSDSSAQDPANAGGQNVAAVFAADLPAVRCLFKLFASAVERFVKPFALHGLLQQDLCVMLHSCNILAIDQRPSGAHLIAHSGTTTHDDTAPTCYRLTGRFRALAQCSVCSDLEQCRGRRSWPAWMMKRSRKSLRCYNLMTSRQLTHSAVYSSIIV